MARSQRVMIGLVLAVAVAAPLAWSLSHDRRPQRQLAGAQVSTSSTTSPTAPTDAPTTTSTSPTTTSTSPTSPTIAPSSTNAATTDSKTSSSTSMPRRDVPTTPATAAEVADPSCPAAGHAAIIDRKRQRAALCTDGRRGEEFVVTTAISMPDPGTYTVYAKDLRATSTFGGHFSTMTHFVAFSYGERTGARVAFHSLPKLRSGEFVQDPATVGKVSMRGESNGCIRVLPDQAVVIWDHLQIGSKVVVLN